MLAKRWGAYAQLTYTGDYFWKAETGDKGERACFGLTGCRMAWIHILEHPDDVDGAKELAAFYCLDHADDCHTEVYLNGAVNDAMEAAIFLGRGSYATAAGGARSVAAEGAGARAAAEPVVDPEIAGSAMVRVGRWMGRDEYDKMVKTGMVQEGRGGVTYVAFPATPEAYRGPAKPDTGYVEFDVPEDSLYSAGDPRWMRMSTPDGQPGRIARLKNLPIPELPCGFKY